MVFQHVALAGNAQRWRSDADAAGDVQIAAALLKARVVGIAVHQRAVHGAEIFRPLLLDVNQRPLAAAEFEVLQPGQQEIGFFCVIHHIRMQLTPSGSRASSTVTL